MSGSVWPSDLNDMLAINATPYVGEPLTTGDPSALSSERVAGSAFNASFGLFDSCQTVSGMYATTIDVTLMTSDVYPHGIATDYTVAPDTLGFSPSAIPRGAATPPLSTIQPPHDFKPPSFAELADPYFSQPRYFAKSQSSISAESVLSGYSSSSENSESDYPSPAPHHFNTLEQANGYIAQPLTSPDTSYYIDYPDNAALNAAETLCLFNDIDAQFYASPVSYDSSTSPGPIISTGNYRDLPQNYSGPIKSQVLKMETDANDVVWIEFPYSKNKEVSVHRIRCDVESVPPSKVKPEIKSVATAVRPASEVKANS